MAHTRRLVRLTPAEFDQIRELLARSELPCAYVADDSAGAGRGWLDVPDWAWDRACEVVRAFFGPPPAGRVGG